MESVEQLNYIEQIREILEIHKHDRLFVKAELGRGKVDAKEGVVAEVHPRLFILNVERRRGANFSQSYQYADILVGRVDVLFNEESLFKDFKFKEPKQKKKASPHQVYSDLLDAMEDDLLFNRCNNNDGGYKEEKIDL
ncbi:MAG: Veg family protein [Eggerthellaceae bacterium]|nr:Veg family protein [Eggerthellaceae bacterium]